MLKIVKFGGSSVANAGQFKKVKDIVLADSSRKFVVVSACGKSNSQDNKITDLLYLVHAHVKYNIDCSHIFGMIEEKYMSIKEELNLKFDIKKELDLIKSELNKGIDLDYLVSRGEYLTALLMAEYLDYTFVDAKDLIAFNFDGSFNYPKIQENFDKIIKDNDKLIIPGFYGALPNGDIKIMSRGGGDLTGSVMANIINADVYENWTDVPGILVADPRIIKNPKIIDVINYSELRELSYMGASVLHEEAIFPVKSKNIPIHILNTNDTSCKGTIIKEDISDDTSQHYITGIAGKKDFSIITIKKSHMSNEIGMVRQVLEIFEKYHVSVEHMPSGIDSFSVVVETEPVKRFIYEILAEIKTKCKAEDITVIDEIALIATVSRNMKNRAGMSGRLFTTLGNAGISVAVISQAGDEMNIIVGVNNSDYSKTIKAIYQEFEGKIYEKV